MEPRARRIICEYWDIFRMVARAGGYYGVAFKVFRRVTQVDPLPPTIFLMMVHAVVCHCISLVPGGAGGKNGWGREV